MIKIFAQVRKEMPAKLLMIGDGPERSGCETLARVLGVHEDIRFLGKQEQMEDILPIADLFYCLRNMKVLAYRRWKRWLRGCP